MKAIVLFVCMLVPVSALAEDTAATMAALRDAGAECRYLQSLCKRVSTARKLSDEANGEHDSVMKKARADVASGNVSRAGLDELSRHEGRLRGATQAHISAVTGCIQAENVLKSKHEKLPKCYKPCCQ